ncbi:DNA-3-methyladenine glycosylase 2 family protein [Pilimelia columellifera]
MGVDRVMGTPPGYRLGWLARLLTFSAHDPCARFLDGSLWWAARTPEGPGTLWLRPAPGQLLASGHGPGGSWLVERADAVAGLRDRLDGFAALAASRPTLARLAGAVGTPRLPATGLVFQRLLRSVLEQKVTGTEAYRAYAATVRHFGEPAPGPVPLLLPPDPDAVASAGYWVFHRFGVEQRRADTLARAAAAAARLERCGDSSETTARLTAVDGIGRWTAAEVVRVVHGDADAVSVGDYHVKNTVSWALAGEPRGTDERMLELLAPFAGHRGRVCLLLEAAGLHAPRYGPRATIRSFHTY